jgi:hypothetical protein
MIGWLQGSALESNGNGIGWELATQGGRFEG